MPQFTFTMSVTTEYKVVVDAAHRDEAEADVYHIEKYLSSDKIVNNVSLSVKDIEIKDLIEVCK